MLVKSEGLTVKKIYIIFIYLFIYYCFWFELVDFFWISHSGVKEGRLVKAVYGCKIMAVALSENTIDEVMGANFDSTPGTTLSLYIDYSILIPPNPYCSLFY